MNLVFDLLGVSSHRRSVAFFFCWINWQSKKGYLPRKSNYSALAGLE